MYTKKQKLRYYSPFHKSGRWNIRFNLGYWIGGFTSATRASKREAKNA